MKLRLIVMNGQRIVEAEEGGKWKIRKVDKARDIKPGLYNLYQAHYADKSQDYKGLIVHADKNRIYQQIGKRVVVHACADFDQVPGVGWDTCIRYNQQGRTVVADVQKPGHGLSH